MHKYNYRDTNFSGFIGPSAAQIIVRTVEKNNHDVLCYKHKSQILAFVPVISLKERIRSSRMDSIIF